LVEKMARTLEFSDEVLCIHFSGLTSAAALKKKIEIPYEKIKDVCVGPFEISSLSFRVGTSGIGKNLKEGRFLYKGNWCFLSFENHERVLILELEGHEYKKVVLEMDNPESEKEKIIRKCSLELK
jgi:hypothetical protein